MNDFRSMNEGTFACLHDKKRATAFKRAINNSTKKGDVVVDVGPEAEFFQCVPRTRERVRVTQLT